MAKSSTSFVKGKAKGKPKGVQNKVTRDIKEAFRLLIENNLENMTLWLETVAKKNPAQALFIISNLAEYTTPKLARSQVEHSNPDGSLKQPPSIIVTSQEIKEAIQRVANG